MDKNDVTKGVHLVTMDMKITKEQHIKRHTKKENTHNFECPYCEGLK